MGHWHLLKQHRLPSGDIRQGLAIPCRRLSVYF